MKLTQEQQERICRIIGEWYLKWKGKIADYDNETHLLGQAREDLKDMICNEGE